ncbi:MAG: vWA domain-containing protein [Kofleriaceae bacterium]
MTISASFKGPVTTGLNRLGLIAVMLAACGGSKTGDGTVDANNNSGDDANTNIPNYNCTTTSDCTPPQVCQPVSMTCEDPGTACSTQAECTGGTYCESTAGVCLPSSNGTPCAGPDNCTGECIAGVCGCDGVAHECELEISPLDIYLVLDRTASMGNDCAYTSGTSPPVNSKACYATYALADYVTTVQPASNTTLAFGLMSLSNACDGTGYDPAIIAAAQLPVATNSALVNRISSENFSGGYGTRIEGALRGIATYTTNHKATGREMIGVLITDGDATNCVTNTNSLATIISTHRTNTGIRTFIIGMTGADEATLETLAIAGGADAHNDFCGGRTPPCHFWSVGDGSGAALESALQAIAQQAVPLPCEIDVTGLTPPPGEQLDYGKVNVTLTENGTTTTIGQVPDMASCPAMTPAWYYDNPSAPTTIHLCPAACTAVGAAGDGANLNVVAGCNDTVVIF